MEAYDWALTFSGGRMLSIPEMADIARRAGYSVGFLGKVEDLTRWDYNLYVSPSKPLSEEGLKYMKSKGLTIFIHHSDHKGLVDKVFPNHERDLVSLG